MDNRLRASSRHGGATGFFIFFHLLNRRGGAPSGATALIVPDGERGNKFLSHYGPLLYPASASYFLPDLQSRPCYLTRVYWGG